MSIPDDKIPKTKNKHIGGIILNAVKFANEKLSGKTPGIEEGPFGKNLEFLAYELAKKSELDLSPFTYAKRVDDKLIEIFRDVADEPSVAELKECLTIGLYGFIVGNYSDEDFRYLYRYTFKDIRNHAVYADWLLKGLASIACFEHEKPDEVLSGIRSWIRFLGVPLSQPSDFQDPCAEFGIDIDPILSSEGLRLLTTLTSHP
ncbi:MAG: hypothetical protein KAQ65_09025, partial [Candidatus Thorarchaeota archaeon]|nr:hypothetical protein [Candidatus Thorarchaeota archaeon]